MKCRNYGTSRRMQGRLASRRADAHALDEDRAMADNFRKP
jgi:hypothetical protein